MVHLTHIVGFFSVSGGKLWWFGDGSRLRLHKMIRSTGGTGGGDGEYDCI
ncbi:hypothetical protein Hdeb2414_s0009g00327191 [Helianthus debilis subsp. tardiflorus]